MDLIYTNENRIDQGVLSAYSFDLSFGAEENDFEITLGSHEPALKFGAFVFVEGTEYGGIIDSIKTSTNGKTVTYSGRTWHGILNSKVIEPDYRAAYYVVSGEANSIIASMIDRFALASLFSAVESSSGIEISRYQFNRYCRGYDGLRAMLAENGAKLKFAWADRSVKLSAEPIANYTFNPVDGDNAVLSVERHQQKVNHLVCLGKGELADREVIHLYVDPDGKIGNSKYFVGIDEVAEVYDDINSEDLRADGIKKLSELRDIDKAEISIPENVGFAYDIGDIVPAVDYNSGISVSAAVSQKIVKINNGTVKTEYKTGS